MRQLGSFGAPRATVRTLRRSAASECTAAPARRETASREAKPNAPRERLSPAAATGAAAARRARRVVGPGPERERVGRWRTRGAGRATIGGRAQEDVGDAERSHSDGARRPTARIVALQHRVRTGSASLGPFYSGNPAGQPSNPSFGLSRNSSPEMKITVPLFLVRRFFCFCFVSI